MVSYGKPIFPVNSKFDSQWSQEKRKKIFKPKKKYLNLLPIYWD